MSGARIVSCSFIDAQSYWIPRSKSRAPDKGEIYNYSAQKFIEKSNGQAKGVKKEFVKN
jgi:hypothetical protein